jgi:signal peptidase II
MSSPSRSISPNILTGTIALIILILDQVSKGLVIKTMKLGDEKAVLEGFFRFVYWGNTGAAWSVFSQRNGWLAIFASAALVALWIFRRHFEFHRTGGQIALGFLFGGIIGNLIDRVLHNHVVDFLRFYWIRRSGEEIGFPAFNVADMAISTSVGILLLLTWQTETGRAPSVKSAP